MAPDSQTRKLFLLLIASTLLLGTASAADLEPVNGNNVWLDGEDTKEFEIVLEGGESVENVTLIREDADNIEISTGADNLTTSDFSREGVDTENYNLSLYLNTSESIRQEVSVRELGFENIDSTEGTGFVDQKLGAVEGTEPVEFTLNPDNTDLESISTTNLESSFAIKEPEAEMLSSSDVEIVKVEQSNGKEVLEVTAHPYIDEMVSGDLTLQLKHDGVSFEKEFSPDIYSLRAVPSNDRPPIELDYNRIGEFAYNLNIYKEGSKVSNTDVKLYEENFTLEIKGISEDASFDDDEDRSFLDVEAIDNENAEYRLTLDRIPQLDAGQYRFTTRLLTKEHDNKGIFIDSIRVNNGLRLSGRVQDSESSSIQAKFTLVQGNTEIPITTTSTGDYYKEIGSAKSLEDFDEVRMRFFDTYSFSGSPDARITARSVSFKGGQNRNLAGDSESIKFQYWSNPPVEQKAINPINMMAVKFAYPMASEGHPVSMAYNPANVDPDNLKVYSCSYWNFEGRKCFGEWDEVGDISINHKGSRVNFQIMDPYLAEDVEGEDQNILMNAYIVGTSADLVLNGGLTISGPEDGRVSTGSEVTVEGNINSENGNAVEGANVEVAFYQGDTEVADLDEVETDITGRFVATGDAPDEPGNYSVKVTADKENYNMMEKEFENRFETFIREGVAVETDLEDDQVEITPGEDRTVELTVRNTGQTDMNDVELSFTGFDSEYYSVTQTGFSEIPEGEEEITELTFSLPSDYCDTNDCSSYPQLDVSAEAENDGGETFEAEETTIYTQLSRTQTSGSGDSESSTDQESSDTEETNESGSAFSESVSDLENATGEFLASQSSLNLALGLIMVFMMVLAGAVKKQNNGGSRSDRGGRNGRDGGRPMVQKPDVAGSSEVKQVQPGNQDGEQVDNVVEQINRAEKADEDVDSQIEAIASTVSAEQQDDTAVVEVDDHQETGMEGDEEEGVDNFEVKEVDGEKKFVCKETGEEFDTKAALKLHRQINGLEN